MKTTFTITGMHCDACRRLIEKRIRTVAGVADVTVTLETGTATVTAGRTVSADEIRAALAGMEYQVA